MLMLTLSAIAPIVAILILGKLIARTQIISDAGWLGIEAITYYVLFPALIISKLALADFSDLDWRLPTSLIAAQLVLAGISIALARWRNEPGDRIGVYVQSGVRWNTFIALALAQGLMGPQGLALVTVAAAAMIPTANLISIAALTRFSDDRISPGLLLRKIFTNPLILALLAGLGLNAAGTGLWTVVASVLDILAQAAIATGLLASGAYVQLRGGKTPVPVILAWSSLRLLGLPLAAGAIAYGLGILPELLLIVLIATAVPTASNGAILARQLGGDATLAANLIAFQTILSMISIAMILWVAGQLRII